MVVPQLVPKWLSCHMKDADLPAIEAAVVSAEKKTSAEIVPMVVRASSNYFQTHMTLLLLGGIFFALFFHLSDLNFYWDHYYQSLALMVVGFVVVLVVFPRLAKIPYVQRVMTHRFEENEQVAKRAQIEFYQNCLETADQVGVLIYISLMEHQVVVLTDKKIAAIYGPETWQKIVQDLLGQIKQKKMAEGLKTAINSIADLLQGPFPLKSDDKDELSNKLIIKD